MLVSSASWKGSGWMCLLRSIIQTPRSLWAPFRPEDSCPLPTGSSFPFSHPHMMHHFPHLCGVFSDLCYFGFVSEYRDSLFNPALTALLRSPGSISPSLLGLSCISLQLSFPLLHHWWGLTSQPILWLLPFPYSIIPVFSTSNPFLFFPGQNAVLKSITAMCDHHTGLSLAWFPHMT